MKILRSLKKYTKTLLVLSSITMISFNSYAGKTKVVEMISNISSDQNGVTTVSVGISASNECSGNDAYFSTGNGFSNCQISVDYNGTKFYFTDDNVIAKFDTNENVQLTDGYAKYSESDKYKDIIAPGMWDFTSSEENKTGTWTYTNPNKYPDIRYWVSKAGAGKNGSGLRLFWTIENNEAGYCGAGDDTSINLNYDCMNLAQSVTSGDWTTPANKGLSHITFFGGLCTVNCDVPPTPVPEPTTFVIFALGLLGIAVRRKQSIKATK
jgi:hypothetical protein